MKLFPREVVAGIFRGFSRGGLEFHADLVLPYKSEFQSTPMHGQFVLVQLEHEDEAVLGRITSIAAQGRLASSAGEDYVPRRGRQHFSSPAGRSRSTRASSRSPTISTPTITPSFESRPRVYGCACTAAASPKRSDPFRRRFRSRASFAPAGA